MLEWLIKNSAIFAAELIGALGIIGAVVITIIVESRHRKKERIEMIKPIVINAEDNCSKEVREFVFESNSEKCDGRISGNFKNTDNGILFIDYVQTETKLYHPKNSAVVDKNSFFKVILVNIGGETLKKCVIFFHDILGNKYQLDAAFKNNTIVLVKNDPTPID